MVNLQIILLTGSKAVNPHPHSGQDMLSPENSWQNGGTVGFCPAFPFLSAVCMTFQAGQLAKNVT